MKNILMTLFGGIYFLAVGAALIALFLMIGSDANAKDVIPKDKFKVAVIDTGFNYFSADNKLRKQLCAKGHYDFALRAKGIGFDTIGHGTLVTKALNDAANTKNYCILTYKVFGFLAETDRNVVAKAVVKAVQNGAKVINISLSIFGKHQPERKVFKWASKKGVKIFVSAGNEGRSLDKHCTAYPACYKRMKNVIVVGSKDSSHLVERYSNYGMRIDVYEYGTLENGARGTSFASPRAAGYYVRALDLDSK